MSPLRRLHRGYLGLWVNALNLAIGTMILGAAFAFDGRGVTSSSTFDPAKHLIGVFGVRNADAMFGWGLLFIAAGLVKAVPLLSTTATAMQRGLCGIPILVLWSTFAAMFASYGLSHDGLGFTAAVVYVIIAVDPISVGLTYTGYARRPRPQLQ